MKLSRLALTGCALLLAALVSGCSSDMNVNKGAAASPTPAAAASPAAQALAVTDRPQKIMDMMRERGEQDEAAPVLKIAEPADGSTVNGSTVKVRLNLSGDLKGYKPHKDPSTQMGNHIHVILDNEPYEAYYDLDQPFELRNVTEGPHTLRVFASRPWHESYKNDGSFQMVSFTVKGGGDSTKPTTTNGGQVMANNNSAASNSNAAPPREGKDYPAKPANTVLPDRTKPLLTYSRPKGEYKGDDANVIMIDFWLSNAKLKGDGGDYRVRYSVDGGEAKFIDKWESLWLAGWAAGKHSVKLELVDGSGNPVDNGGYNSTTREITVTK